MYAKQSLGRRPSALVELCSCRWTKIMLAA